jgi:hypothetical protein
MPNAETLVIARRSETVLVALLLASPGASEASKMVRNWAAFARENPHALVQIFALGSARAKLIPVPLRDDRILSLGLNDLDERDLRRDFLALHALHGALRLLHTKATRRRRTGGRARTTTRRPTLFFSHAKRDGVPLSTSLVSWIKRLRGFDFFYDTLNLDLSGDISAQLEQAIGASILIVLRTEVFDQRYWCQEEAFWAEKHGVPVIAVDARWNVKIAPSVIALDSSPSVRIPDGSLVRILQAALEEALRVALHRARASLIAKAARLPRGSWVTISRQPSLVSLESAARIWLAGNPRRTANQFLVVYPNPAMPDGLRDSAAFACQSLIPGSQLLSLDEFRVYCMPRMP